MGFILIEWASVAAVVSAIAAAIAAGVSSWQALKFRKHIKEDYRTSKIKHTLELNPHYSEEYIKASKQLYSQIPTLRNIGKISNEDWKKIEGNIELMASVAQILHYWSRFSISYYNETIDKEIAKTLCRAGFLNVMKSFENKLREIDNTSGSELMIKLLEEWES